MNKHPHLVAGALLLALAACTPLAAQYTASEAPKNLVVDNASSRIDLRFAPGSSRLYPRDAWRLRVLAANGTIAPSDSVTVAAGGGPRLAAARFATISSALLSYGITARPQQLAGVPANVAILETGRYLVTLPACPDWSKEATVRFTNSPASNFGCATAVDLGMSVANPADLAEGRPAGLAEGEPASTAVDRYLAGKVALPTAVALTTIPSGGNTASAGGTGGAAP
jgi:pilus biogenesis lipoprotein CpaD